MKLSQDLRRRIVEAHENGEGGVKRLAKRFSVAISTVKKLFRLKKETGDIKPVEYVPGPAPKILDSDLPKLQELVKEKPDMTTKDIREQWKIHTGVNVSHSTMIRALQRANLTFKKKRLGVKRGIQKKT